MPHHTHTVLRDVRLRLQLGGLAFIVTACGGVTDTVDVESKTTGRNAPTADAARLDRETLENAPVSIERNRAADTPLDATVGLDYVDARVLGPREASVPAAETDGHVSDERDATPTVDAAPLAMTTDFAVEQDSPADGTVDAVVAPDASPAAPPADRPTSSPQLNLDGVTGSLVTADCTYRGYEYAVDILLSCGNERFGSPLRLHTFKRHSHDHQAVFNDQRLTVRDDILWFEAYDPPRCIQADGRGRLQLTTQRQQCTRWRFERRGNGYQLHHPDSRQCAGLGGATCADHRWTGGVECNGIQHRYLPLVLGNCDNALTFQFKDRAPFCANEFPRPTCF